MLFQTCTVIVRGLPQDSTEDTVLNYFENSKRSKGGAVEEVKIEGNVARVKFESSEGNLNNVMTFFKIDFIFAESGGRIKQLFHEPWI